MEFEKTLGSDSSNWAKSWENTVTAVLAEQDEIQADIDASLRRGDLVEAASASFEHVLTSFQLGDRVEGHSYLLVGMAFMQAAALLQNEQEQPESFIFRIPNSIYRQPMPKNIYKTEDGSIDYDALEQSIDKYKAMLAKVPETIAAAEGALLLDAEIFPNEINEALRDAITATCDVIFSDHPRDGIDSFFATETTSERLELLGLAKRLARHLIINTDGSSTELAFEAYEKLMLAAMYANGRTLRVINQAIAAFEEMQYGLVSKNTSLRCAENIQDLKFAKQMKIGATALTPIQNMWFAFEPVFKGSNDYKPPARARLSRSMRNQVRETYRLRSQLVTELAEVE